MCLNCLTTTSTHRFVIVQMPKLKYFLSFSFPSTVTNLTIKFFMHQEYLCETLMVIVKKMWIYSYSIIWPNKQIKMKLNLRLICDD